MAKNITVSRAYDRKNSDGGKDRLGIAEFTIESKSDIGFMLNGQELPAASVDHLLTFALQSLQDAYAGADSTEDAQSRFEAKLKRILEGTLGTRSGSSADPIMAEIRSIIRNDVKAAVGKDAWAALDDDARDAAIDGVFADQSDETKATLTEAAKESIARKAAEKAAKAALGAKLSIKLA